VKKLLLLGVMTFGVAGLMMGPGQAAFVQCPGGAGPITLTDCNALNGTTDNADIINGSRDADRIVSLEGNDLNFGGEGNDRISTGDGNDVLFGGPGSDFLIGAGNDDLLLAGPDDFSANQETNGGEGTDATMVLAGDTVNCLLVQDSGGFDVANLVGFGPYVVEKPFGLQPGYGNGWIGLIDPIGGGNIYIRVKEDDDQGIERINGLANPNVTVLNIAKAALPGCILV
jgi:hypothetical protein